MVGSAPLCLGAWLAVAVPVELQVDGPEPLVLGEVETVDVILRAPETPEVAGRPLRLSVNVGAFGPVEAVEPGVYRSTYRLPEAAFPQVALVAVWRETGPDADIRFFRIPLHGRTVVPVRAPSGSRVTVRVEDAVFGPVTAAGGRAEVPIIVPPGVEEVTVVSRRGDEVSQAQIAAGVPPYNRLTLALTPYKVPSDGASQAILHAYVDRVPPVAPERVQVSAPRGRLERLEAQGSVYRFRYVPDRADARARVTLTGRVAGEPASAAEAELELGLPVPERVVLPPASEPWVADGVTPFEVSVLVTDQLGLGVDGLELTARAAPANLEEVRPEGDGRYRLRLAPLATYPPAGQVELTVTAPRDDAAPLRAEVALPVVPPPWPTAVEIDPEAELEDPNLAFVRWRAEDAAGAPFDGGGFEVTVNGDAAGPPQPEGPGRYRSPFDPGPHRRRVEARVAHPRGVTAERPVRIDRDQARLEVGARVGPLYSEGLHLLGGVGVGVRLPGLGERVVARLRVAFFQRAQTLDVDFAGGEEALDARLAMLPIGLGATVDALRFRRGAIYVGAFGLMAPGFETLEPRFAGRVQRGGGLWAGVEGVAGVAWRGLFVELGAAALPSVGGGSDLQAPEALWSATLGYRLGLL